MLVSNLVRSSYCIIDMYSKSKSLQSPSVVITLYTKAFLQDEFTKCDTYMQQFVSLHKYAFMSTDGKE